MKRLAVEQYFAPRCLKRLTNSILRVAALTQCTIAADATVQSRPRAIFSQTSSHATSLSSIKAQVSGFLAVHLLSIKGASSSSLGDKTPN